MDDSAQQKSSPTHSPLPLSDTLPFGERPFIALYSAVAGFVDTAGFVTLAGLFTAHVTSNLVLAGAAVSDPEKDIFSRLIMIPIFIVGVICAAFLADRARRNQHSPIRPLLMAQSVGLIIFLILGTLAEQRANHQPLTTLQVILVGGVGVFAMAFQNAFMRDVATTLPASTLMTGNLTQITLDSVRQIADPLPERTMRLKRQIPALVGFLVGATLGAVGVLHFGFLSLFLPTVVVVMLALKSSSTISFT